MAVLVTGSSGLIGTALLSSLERSGTKSIRMLRKGSESGENLNWDPASGAIESARMEGLHAVIHLAGENIAGGRWTDARKAAIRESRVQGTTLLSQTLSKLANPPKLLITASASGFYGDRGDEILYEDSPAGKGFLPEVCRQWEEATEAAASAGIRVVQLRFGLILTPKGGALQRMLLPFRLGAGGKLGSGNQYWSWISLDDVVGVIHHAMNTETLQGPVNVVTPNPVTNAEFTRVLGRVLQRPAVFPVPAFVARLAFGEMADELLLSSFRMQPRKLLETGYEFRNPDLDGALRYLLQ